jgi:hypothetical protein
MRKTKGLIFDMQRKLLLFLVSCLFTFHSSAQTGEKGISLSAGINLPLGDFSSTHLLGFGIDCSPVKHWFGITSKKKIAFTYNGGVTYYFGKKETVSGYPYDYPGYFFIHAFGGILFNPVKNGIIILTAGPALGMYNGHTQFNTGSKLETSYYISNNIAIGPGIILMKEAGADPLWSAAFKVSVAL